MINVLREKAVVAKHSGKGPAEKPNEKPDVEQPNVDGLQEHGEEEAEKVDDEVVEDEVAEAESAADAPESIFADADSENNVD